MKRLLIAAGIAAVTAFAVRQALASPAVRQALDAALTDVRAFRSAVRDGMTEREGELRSALGLDSGVPRDAAVLNDPTGPRAR